MAQDKDNIQKLYDGISTQFDVGTIDDFKSKMGSAEDRKSFFNTVKENGLDLGDYDEYESRLSYFSVPKKELSGDASAPTSETLVEPLSEEDKEEQGFLSSAWNKMKASAVGIGSGLLQKTSEWGAMPIRGAGGAYVMPQIRDNVTNELRDRTPEENDAIIKEAKQQAVNVKEVSEKLQASTEQFDKGITDNIAHGNFFDAGKQAVYSLFENAPIMLSLMMNSPLALTALGVGSAGQKELEMRSENESGSEDYSDNNIFWTSWGYGTTDVIAFALMGKIIGQSGKLINNVAKKAGEDAGKEVSKGFAKTLLNGFALGGGGVGLSKTLQNGIDLASGKNKSILDGVADAIVSGALLSGTTVVTGYLVGKGLSKITPKEQKKIIQDNNKKLQGLDKDLNNPSTPKEHKAVIKKAKKQLLKENKEIIDDVKSKVEAMSEEQRKEAIDKANSVESINKALEDGSISSESKKALLDTKRILEQDIEGLTKQIKEPAKSEVSRADLQSKLDFLKEHGENVKELTIEEIEFKYDNLQKASKKEVLKSETEDLDVSVDIPNLDIEKIQAEISVKEREGTLKDNLDKRVFIKGEEGVLTTDGQTLVVETNGKIIEIGNKNEVGDNFLYEHDITNKPPSGIDVLSKKEVLIDGELNKIISTTTNKKGQRVVKTKDSKGLTRRLVGEKAEIIAKDISLASKAKIESKFKLESKAKKKSDAIKKSTRAKKETDLSENEYAEIEKQAKKDVEEYSKSLDKDSKTKKAEKKVVDSDENIKSDEPNKKGDKVLTLLDKAIDATSPKNTLFDASLGIPMAAANASLRIIKLAYTGGKGLAISIKNGLDYLKSKGFNVNETKYNKYVLNELKKSKENVQEPKIKAIKMQESSIQDSKGKNVKIKKTKRTKQEPVNKIIVDEYKALTKQVQMESSAAKQGAAFGSKRVSEIKSSAIEYAKKNITKDIRENMGDAKFKLMLNAIDKADTHEKLKKSIKDIHSYVLDTQVSNNKKMINVELKKKIENYSSVSKKTKGRLGRDEYIKIKAYRSVRDNNVAEIKVKMDEMIKKNKGVFNEDQESYMQGLMAAELKANADATSGNRKGFESLDDYIENQTTVRDDYQNTIDFLKNTIEQGRKKMVKIELGAKLKREQDRRVVLNSIMNKRIADSDMYDREFITSVESGTSISDAITAMRDKLDTSIEFHALSTKEKGIVSKLLDKASNVKKIGAASKLIQKALGTTILSDQEMASFGKQNGNLGFTPETHNIVSKAVRGLLSSYKGLFRNIEAFEGLVERMGGVSAKAQAKIKEILVKPVKKSYHRLDELFEAADVKLEEAYKIIKGEFKYDLHKSTEKYGIKMKLEDGTIDRGLEKLSIMKCLKIHMMMQNPNFVDKLLNNNKYSKESVNDLMKHIDNVIGKEPKLLAYEQELFDFYKWVYEEANPVYRSMYNIDLPFIENYSPDSIFGLDEQIIDADSYNTNSSVFAANIIRRRTHRKPYNLNVDATQDAMNYKDQMLYFTAFGKTIQDLNATLSNSEVTSVIRQKMGNNYITLLKNQLNDMANNGSRLEKDLASTGVQKAMTNYTGAVLGLNLKVGITQVSSMLNYAAHCNTLGFSKELSNIARNPKQYYKDMNMLAKTPFVRQRMKKGWTFDAKIFMNEHSQVMRGVKKLKKTWLLPGRYGDAGGVLLGGTAFYRVKFNEYIKTMTEVEARNKAIMDWENASSTQQSRRMSDLSSVQRSKGVMRAFTPFMSTPILYHQQLMSAARNIVQGRATVYDAKKLMMYGITSTVAFNILQMGASNLFGYDNDDDNKTRIEKSIYKTALKSPTQGIPIINKLTGALVDIGIEGSKANPFSSNFKPAPTMSGIVNVAESMIKMYGEFEKNGMTDKFYEESYNLLLTSGEAASGTPLKNIKKLTYDNFLRMTGDLDYEDWREFLGYTQRNLGIEEYKAASNRIRRKIAKRK